LNNRIVCAVTLSLCIVFIALVKVCTIPPGRISGNGNPGLLVLLAALFPYAVLVASVCIESVKLLYRSGMGKGKLALSTIVLSLSIAFCADAQVEAYHRLLNELGGDAANPDSKIYRLFIVNQYTNAIFFNANIVCIGIGSAILLGLFLYALKKKR